jgi:hypothetical protein
LNIDEIGKDVVIAADIFSLLNENLKKRQAATNMAKTKQKWNMKNTIFVQPMQYRILAITADDASVNDTRCSTYCCSISFSSDSRSTVE